MFSNKWDEDKELGRIMVKNIKILPGKLTKIVFEMMLAVEMERRHEMSRHPVPSRQALAVTRKKSSSPAV